VNEPRPRRYLPPRARGGGPVPFVPRGDPGRRPVRQAPPAGHRVPGRGGGRAGRLGELLLAVAAIVATFPLMALIAVLVRATSPGPILVEERRVGLDRRRPDRRDRRREAGAGEGVRGGRRGDRRALDRGGRLFRAFRFRTTYVVPVQDDAPRLPGTGRPTPVGRVLSAFRLDELPRLFSLVLGDMRLTRPGHGERGRPSAPLGWDGP
jgi:hypothetical protein